MRGRFGATALAPLAVNGGLILTLVAIETGFSLPLVQKASWLAAASSLAGLIQLVIVAAALLQGGPSLVRFRWPRWSPLMKSFLLAGFPVLAASGAVQIFFLAATQIASFWPSGIAWLYYAERVMQLPLGLMAALGSSLLLPELARRYRAGEMQAIAAAQNRALEAALLLSLPAAAALVILARPMSAVLFERGAFESSDAEGTALVLAALSLGLPFATVAKVLSQSLFACGSLRAALMAAIAGLVLTVAGRPRPRLAARPDRDRARGQHRLSRPCGRGGGRASPIRSLAAGPGPDGSPDADRGSGPRHESRAGGRHAPDPAGRRTLPRRTLPRRPCALCAWRLRDRRRQPRRLGFAHEKRMRTHENPCIVARPCHNARLNGLFSGEAASASPQEKQSDDIRGC